MRRAHANARHLRLELAFELACVVRRIGRSAAHVETDHPFVAAELRGPSHADDATRRPRQDGVLALEGVRIGEPARGLHEEQLDARHFSRNLLDVAPKDGREIGINHGRIPAADELHHRAGFVRSADLRETHLLRDAFGGQFVLAVPVAMQEDDRDAAQTALPRRFQFLGQRRLVRRREHLAARAHALPCFDHRAVQQLGQHDVPVEQPRSVLIGDSQRIAKALRSHQQRCLALALEQGVGGDGSTHLHAVDHVGRDGLARLQAQQVSDARDGRVLVVFRVFRQQLVREQRAVRPFGDDVRESAAAVDPELPAGR